MEKLEDFLNRTERLLQSANLRLTDRRRYILEALFESEIPLSGLSIQKQVWHLYRIKIAIGSIYKILNILSYYNVLHVLTLAPYKTKHYSIKDIKSQNYLVCTKCGKISLFFDKVLEKQLKEKLEKKDFILMNHRIVLYGTCKDCQ